MDKNSKIIYYVPVGENSMYGLNDKIITEIKKIQENNKVRMLLFGSRARGNYKENSDIDIAIIDNVNHAQKYKILDEFDQINTAYKIDVVFIDPPYKENLAVKAIEQIISLDLLNRNGIMIIETDEKERDLKELEILQVEVYDLRKYGRAHLIFLNRKE